MPHIAQTEGNLHYQLLILLFKDASQALQLFFIFSFIYLFILLLFLYFAFFQQIR